MRDEIPNLHPRTTNGCSFLFTEFQIVHFGYFWIYFPKNIVDILQIRSIFGILHAMASMVQLVRIKMA